MALQGSISDFGLSDIFQLILHQKKSGALVVTQGGEELQIFFENGMVIYAEPTNQDPLNKIGEKLVKTGRITQEQLEQALSQQKKSKDKIGQILLKMGAISKKDLFSGLNMQVRETLYTLFRLTEGNYSFTPRDIPYDQSIWEPINTEFILMEGMRRVDEWPLLEKAIPSFEMIFGKIDENSNKIQGVKEQDEDNLDDMFGDGPSEEGLYLTQAEMSIYEAIDGNRSVQQLIDLGNLGDFETCKALNNLKTASLIQALKTPQKPDTQAPKVKIKTSAPRKPVFTARNIGTSILFITLIGSLVFGYGNLSVFGNQTRNLFKPYKNLILDSQFQQISFAIQTYRFKFSRLPSSLEEISRSGFLDPDLLIDPWGEAIQYRAGEDGLKYQLHSNYGS